KAEGNTMGQIAKHAAALGSALGGSPANILVGPQERHAAIQDFTPLASSLEWELGQQYLRQRGSRAFLSDAVPVPFAINNSGNMSVNAAELLYRNLSEAERTGALETEIIVLEIGVGLGLFARYFLDVFRDICKRQGKDYYDRLRFIAAD